MKTLLLNPPSFEKLTEEPVLAGRHAAKSLLRYPVWLSYPAGLIRESRLRTLLSRDNPGRDHPNCPRL